MAERGGGSALRRVIMRPSVAAEVMSQRRFEFHPVTPGTYIGIASVLRKTGFVEVLWQAEHQPSMRYLVGGISNR